MADHPPAPVEPVVVVPFNPGEPHRDRNWAWLRERWRVLHGWPVIESPCEGAWSKGRAAAAGVNATTADVVVVADADVFCAPDLVNQAVAVVAAGAPWAMPHERVLRLTQRHTDQLVARESWSSPPRAYIPAARRHRAPRGGGIVVVSRAAWAASGGIDPRFVGWGGEDISWARALDTLAGPCTQLDGWLWHLWHPPQPTRPGRRGSAGNESLAGRYLDAAGNPDAMRALVAEHSGRRPVEGRLPAP